MPGISGAMGNASYSVCISLYEHSAGTKNKIFVCYILPHAWTTAYLTRSILLLAFIYEWTNTLNTGGGEQSEHLL